MDIDVLLKNGINASNPRYGVLNHYTLKIGNRASLVPSINEKSYGIVMSINKEDLDKLYSDPSVSDYLPEKVVIVTESNDAVKAVCYILPPTSISGTNKSYAKALHNLANRLCFPSEYLESIRRLS